MGLGLQALHLRGREGDLLSQPGRAAVNPSSGDASEHTSLFQWKEREALGPV